MTLQSVGICVSEYRFMKLLLFLSHPTVCVARWWLEPGNATLSEPDSSHAVCFKTRETSTRRLHAVLGGSSLPCSITEENCTIAKAAFLQKLELQSHVVRQG